MGNVPSRPVTVISNVLYWSDEETAIAILPAATAGGSGLYWGEAALGTVEPGWSGSLLSRV